MMSGTDSCSIYLMINLDLILDLFLRGTDSCSIYLMINWVCKWLFRRCGTDSCSIYLMINPTSLASVQGLVRIPVVFT